MQTKVWNNTPISTLWGISAIIILHASCKNPATIRPYHSEHYNLLKNRCYHNNRYARAAGFYLSDTLPYPKWW
ncbi:hypothetical protein [Chitinophaga nivalis]|uniref:Uncharacterized protein n=1 Tax=Chitinophaga nivalis TaxID=2991709 RepID=A0ABT3IUD0_9BACT|nr:hypothetical protein [Chitinophaga nivalis]MCW3462775.1 hypothetical protein [Chitinophaga nivalis]MCW3487535.1 hypothetical protein [Chitinophaga nivalis]